MIRKSLTIFGTLGVIALFGIIIVVLGANKPTPERGEPQSFDPTVFVDTISYGPVQLTVFAQGEVRPKQEITLTAQVGGTIVSVASSFADGGVIRQGETLIQIEDTDYELAVTRSRAQVATAQTALDIERAEAELAQQDFEELSRGGDVTASALTLRQPQLARAEADYNAALANLRDAELALSRTTIRAPFSGRVRSIAANIGQFVSPGTQLGQIFSTDVAEVRLPLTDSDLAKLDLSLAFSNEETGPPVQLTARAAGRERVWNGRIVRTDAAIDPTTGQVGAIAQVENPYGGGADGEFPLAVGLFVNARIEGPMLDRAVVVPRASVSNGQVFTLNEENVVQARPVSVAGFTEDGAIITDGVEDGETIIVSRLAVPVGSKVRPLKTVPESNAADEMGNALAEGGDDGDSANETADAGNATSGSAVR